MNPYMAASGNEAQISGSIEIDYIYGVGNRLLEMTTRSGSGREDITKFEYDPQGNLLKDGKARYTYDSFNRLQKAETFDGQVQINHYDGEGLRHEIEENGELVQFIYSDKEVVAETNTNGELTRYIRGLGLISADSEKARNYYHYCSDELGSITHILDEEGNTLNNYEYDAFGNTTLCKENVPNRFRYTGQQYDKVTEQYYLRARYYNPIIGRFLQEDSYYNDGLNLYAYGDNNPVRYIDPSGYTKVDAHDKLPGNQQASMDGLNNPQKKTWNEFQHTNKGKYTKAEMSQAWSDYKKSFDINTPKAEIPNNTPTQGNVGRSNKGGSDSNKKGSQADSSSSTKNGKKDNPYNLSNEELQANMDKIYMSAVEDLLSKSADGTLFNGGPRQTTTITPEGTVVISQNSTTVNKQSVITAQQIYGDDIIVINSSKSNIRPGMEGNYGNHAETKGIYYLEKNGYPTEGVKQVSSHYSCDSCESVQKQVGIINVTGYASDNNNVQKRINYSEKD